MRISIILAIAALSLGAAGAAVIVAPLKSEHTFTPFQQIQWLEPVFTPNRYLPIRSLKPAW